MYHASIQGLALAWMHRPRHLGCEAAGAAAAGHGAQPAAPRIHEPDGDGNRGRARAAPGEQLAGQLAHGDDGVERRERQLRQARAQDACARTAGSVQLDWLC